MTYQLVISKAVASWNAKGHHCLYVLIDEIPTNAICPRHYDKDWQKVEIINKEAKTRKKLHEMLTDI